MQFFLVLFTVFFASPCQAYIIPRTEFYVGTGRGGERLAPLNSADKNSFGFDTGLSVGFYGGQKHARLMGMFTFNLQVHLNDDFVFFETFMTGSMGGHTKVGYFTADLLGIGLCINRVSQPDISYPDKKGGPDSSVNLGLLLILPGGFQYHGGENHLFTLGLRFMLNMKLHDGVAQTALKAGAHSYKDVLWKVSLRVSFTVGFDFMFFMPKNTFDRPVRRAS